MGESDGGFHELMACAGVTEAIVKDGGLGLAESGTEGEGVQSC